jgi:hypothetical protein
MLSKYYQVELTVIRTKMFCMFVCFLYDSFICYTIVIVANVRRVRDGRVIELHETVRTSRGKRTHNISRQKEDLFK